MRLYKRFEAPAGQGTETGKLSRLEWRDPYSVSVPAIAHQNRHLIELLNLIIDTLEAGGETEPMLDFPGEVNAGVSAHFALEEQIMRDQHYDPYPDHETDHERLLDNICEIVADGFADGGHLERRDALALRLHDWFVGHSRTRLRKHPHG